MKEREPKRLCMNCINYNWDYGYCNNKESNYYLLGSQYDDTCEEWNDRLNTKGHARISEDERR